MSVDDKLRADLHALKVENNTKSAWADVTSVRNVLDLVHNNGEASHIE